MKTYTFCILNCGKVFTSTYSCTQTLLMHFCKNICICNQIFSKTKTARKNLIHKISNSKLLLQIVIVFKLLLQIVTCVLNALRTFVPTAFVCFLWQFALRVVVILYGYVWLKVFYLLIENCLILKGLDFLRVVISGGGVNLTPLHISRRTNPILI